MNGAYLAEIIGFLLVIAVIVWKIAPPLRRLMNQRQQSIESSIRGAAEVRETAQQELQRRLQLLDEARREAQLIAERAGETAEQIRQDGSRRGEEERRRVADAAEAEIALRRARAVEEIAAMAGEIVVDAAERLVRGEVDAPRQRSLVEETIAAAESTGAAGRSAVR